MKTKQVHVISSSEGEKKKKRGEWGEGEKSREQRGRRDGGNHGYKAGMEGRWCTARTSEGSGLEEPTAGWRVEEEDRLPAVDVMLLLWCTGRIFSDEENLYLSLPPLRKPPMSSSGYIHSRGRDRDESHGGKDGSVVWALVCIPSLTR